MFIFSDHEGGNVSAHATHLVGSALSDPYLSFASGINGIAGPLHSAANEEMLSWIKELRKEVGDNYTQQTLNAFVWKTIKAGKVVPGYGSSILRRTDPRYIFLREFALKRLPDDPLFKVEFHEKL